MKLIFLLEIGAESVGGEVLQDSLMYAPIRSLHSILKNFDFCLLLVGNANEGIR